MVSNLSCLVTAGWCTSGWMRQRAWHVSVVLAPQPSRQLYSCATSFPVFEHVSCIRSVGDSAPPAPHGELSWASSSIYRRAAASTSTPLAGPWERKRYTERLSRREGEKRKTPHWGSTRVLGEPAAILYRLGSIINHWNSRNKKSRELFRSHYYHRACCRKDQ